MVIKIYTDVKELPIEILLLNNLEEIYGTSEFVYQSEIAKKLEEKGVNVVSIRIKNWGKSLKSTGFKRDV